MNNVSVQHYHPLSSSDDNGLAKKLEAAAQMVRKEHARGRLVTLEEALEYGEAYVDQASKNETLHRDAYCDALDRAHGAGYSQNIGVLQPR